MSDTLVKCPICGIPKDVICDLMVGKNSGKNIQKCCCDRLKEKSVKNK